MKSVPPPPPPPPPPDIKGRNKTDLQKRKQIIQSLAVGGLAVTAWQKPIINSVLLPAHAQPSGNTTADPANPSGQAGESGQVGQTEQGQINQEQTAVPQQNQQEQQQRGGDPDHDRLEPLPTRPGDVPIVQIRNAEQCGTIQIARVELADRYHGPGQIDKDYWIKVTGIRTPINPSGHSNTGERVAPLDLRLLIAAPFTLIPLDTISIDSAAGGKNAHPARDSGMFTAFFRNLPANNEPLTQADLNLRVHRNQIVLRCLGTR